MRTITTLVFVFISTFSLFSQTSIEKDIDYCVILLPCGDGNFCELYYIADIHLLKDNIKIFIKTENSIAILERKCALSLENKTTTTREELKKHNPIIEFNGNKIYIPSKPDFTITTCIPQRIKYTKRKDKTFVRIQLENYSHSTVGEYDYFISLEFKDNKCISSKIEEVPWSNLNKYKKGKKQQ